MKTQDRKRGPYAKSAQRRRQIIEAAFDVFAARGYQGGSLQEVADRVGLGHTSILHYFPSKRALLIAVLEQRDAVAKPQRGVRGVIGRRRRRGPPAGRSSGGLVAESD